VGLDASAVADAAGIERLYGFTALRLYGFTALRLYGKTIAPGIGVVNSMCRIAE
jgi:hypothetical protein